MSKNIKAVADAPKDLMPWEKKNKHCKTIGIISPCYGSSHVIYGQKSTRYEHRTVPVFPYRVLDKNGTFFRFTPTAIDFQTDLLHTWNMIPLNRNFIISFELELPRYLGGPSESLIKFGLNRLQSKRCKGIFALSDFARAFAEKEFDKYGFSGLKDKLSVLRGSVPNAEKMANLKQTEKYKSNLSDKKLSAVVIGTQLFRKGGMYAIQAFEKLREQGFDVTLTLIGKFEDSSYAFGDAIPSAQEWTEKAKKHDWIRLQDPIPVDEVFQELLNHDLCIYTSVDESLGWLPIEASMLGVPTIGLKVCAFPELILDKKGGWLIDIPLREDGRWTGLSLRGEENKNAHNQLNHLAVEGIQDCIRAVFKNPEKLNEWGQTAFEWTYSRYSSQYALNELEKAYDKILS